MDNIYEMYTKNGNLACVYGLLRTTVYGMQNTLDMANISHWRVFQWWSTCWRQGTANDDFYQPDAGTVFVPFGLWLWNWSSESVTLHVRQHHWRPSAAVPFGGWCCTVNWWPSCLDPAARSLLQSALQQRTCLCFVKQSAIVSTETHCFHEVIRLEVQGYNHVQAR